jgi:hypothetical protein
MLTPHPSQPMFSNHVPLTPRTPKSSRVGVTSDADGDEAEMRLLGENGRVADQRIDDEEDATLKLAKRPLSKKDKQGMALLSVLCTS